MIHPIDSIRRWWKHSPDEADAPPAAPDGHGNGAASKAPPCPPEPPWLAQLDRADIPRTLVYPSTGLGRILDQSADRFGAATAVVYGATRWSYSELLAQVNRTAGALASLGVRRGDRVLLTLPNCPEMVTTFFAVQKLAAVAVNVGPLMGADDLTTVMTMTAPAVARAMPRPIFQFKRSPSHQDAISAVSTGLVVTTREARPAATWTSPNMKNMA